MDYRQFFAAKTTREHGALVVVLIMGMAPLLWFSPGLVMHTPDLGLPPNIEHWSQLLYMWNETIATGSASILDPCLILFQSIPTVFIWLGFPIWVAQMFSFVFWFLIASFSMYTLARKLFPEANPWGPPLVVVSFYLFNPWQDHIWLGFKPPLIAAYAIMPWFIKLLIDGLGDKDNKNNLFLFAKIAVASFLLSPIGNNISECYAIISFLLLFAIYAMYVSGRNGFGGQAAWFLVRAVFLFIIVNAFWIIPQGIEALRLAGGYSPAQGNLLGWLQGTSKDTSFSNVIRFLGDWTWYDGVGEPYRPYSALYQENLLLIIVSWAIPFLVICGIIFGRFFFKGFFVLITIIAIWLSMGSHPPLGFIYEWMFLHIPYFWIIRSPYFKFLLMACIGYSIFLGALCFYLEKRLKNRTHLSTIISTGVILINLVYGHIIVTGTIFTPKEERTHLPPTKIEIPDYVSEAGRWLDTQPLNSRVFAYNTDRFWTTKWGFRAHEPSLFNFTKQPLIFRYLPEHILRTQGSPNQILDLTNIIQLGLRTGVLPRVDRLLALLNTRFFLLDKSLEFVQGGSYEELKNNLDMQPGIRFVRQFGNYDFYSLDSQLPFVYTSPEITVIAQTTRWHGSDSSSMYPDLVGTATESLFPFSQGNWHPFPSLLLEGQPENEDWEEWLPTERVTSIVSYNPNNSKQDDLSMPQHPVQEQFVFFTKYMNPIGVSGPEASSGASHKQQITLEFLDGFNLEEEQDDGTWIWLTNSGTNVHHIRVHNNSKEQFLSNFAFTATSHLSNRDLHLYLNSDLKKVIPIKANEKKEILVRDLKLRPGENIISFYTPYSAEQKNGVNVSFGFHKLSFRFAQLIYKESIVLPTKTSMEIQIVPMISGQIDWYGDISYAASLKVNGRVVELNRAIHDKIFRLTTHITANAGANSFEFSQNKGGDAAIFFKPVELTPPDYDNASTIDVQKINPTRYRINAAASKPSFLIVSQSYHPGWQLFSLNRETEPKPFKHFKANGFANGYFLPSSGDYELELVFTPQRLLTTGRTISLFGLIGFFGIFIMFQLYKRSKIPPPIKPLSI